MHSTAHRSSHVKSWDLVFEVENYSGEVNFGWVLLKLDLCLTRTVFYWRHYFPASCNQFLTSLFKFQKGKITTKKNRKKCWNRDIESCTVLAVFMVISPLPNQVAEIKIIAASSKFCLVSHGDNFFLVFQNFLRKFNSSKPLDKTSCFSGKWLMTNAAVLYLGLRATVISMNLMYNVYLWKCVLTMTLTYTRTYSGLLRNSLCQI